MMRCVLIVRDVLQFERVSFGYLFIVDYSRIGKQNGMGLYSCNMKSHVF